MKSKNIFARQTLLNASKAFALISLGVIAGILVIRFNYFELDGKFSVINFLTIVLTFVISLHFQNALSHRASDDRVEKSIIIERGKAVENILNRIDMICKTHGSDFTFNSVEASGVLGEFKNLNRELGCLEMLLKCTPIILDLDKFKELRKSCLKVKRLATGGVFPAGALTPGEGMKVSLAINDTLAIIYRFTFYINRL